MFSQLSHAPHRSKGVPQGFSYRNYSLSSSHNVSHTLFINTVAVDGFASGTKNESNLLMLPQETRNRVALVRIHIFKINLSKVRNTIWASQFGAGALLPQAAHVELKTHKSTACNMERFDLITICPSMISFYSLQSILFY